MKYAILVSLKNNLTVCIYRTVSQYESPRYDPGLRCNPGHVVIIFTRVAVTNGAGRYDSMTWPGGSHYQWVSQNESGSASHHSAGECFSLYYSQVWMSPMLFSHLILPPKEKNNLYYNLCSQNIETLITQPYTSGTNTMQ